MTSQGIDRPPKLSESLMRYKEKSVPSIADKGLGPSGMTRSAEGFVPHTGRNKTYVSSSLSIMPGESDNVDAKFTHELREIVAVRNLLSPSACNGVFARFLNA